MSLAVVDPESARYILNSKYSDSEYLVNIRGRVTCISEVIKIKANHLFIVKFIPHVDVIIKRKELLHWQVKLSPYKQFILTKLRPTTLQKGSRTPCRVFTVTKGSQILLPDSVDVEILTASDWLKQHGLLTDMQEVTCNRIQDPVMESLFSYQGKVTGVLDQVLGVYELDGAVRLYVGCVPAAHMFSILHKGVNVLVQNAHHRVSKQDGQASYFQCSFCTADRLAIRAKMRHVLGYEIETSIQYPQVSLYCCMLTSIKCLGDPTQKVEQVKLSRTLQRLLFLTGQSQDELDRMYDLRQTLCTQFLDAHGERLTEKIFTAVVTDERLYTLDRQRADRGPQKLLQRFFLDEFLNVPHHCSLQMSDPQVKVKYSTITEIKEGIPAVSMETMEWRCMRQLTNTGQVVLGILNVCESIGQIVLHDCTGDVEVVTCCCHGDKIEDCEHLCTGACSCDTINVGEKFPCPYVQTCCLGKIIAIPTFEMISETMVTRAVPQHLYPGKWPRSSVAERARPSVGGCDQYLLFDMRDVIYIGNSVEVGDGCDTLNNDTRGVDKQRQMTTTGDECETLNNDTRGVDKQRQMTKTGDGCDTLSNETRGVNKQRHVTKTCDEFEIVNNEIMECIVHNNAQTAKDQVSNAPCDQAPFEIKQKLSTLHKHCRPEGGFFFCRKVECCEKAVAENDEIRIGSLVNVKPDPSIAVQEAGATESDEHVHSRLDLEIKKSSRLSYKLGKTAFKVKPVSNRKRGILKIETEITKVNERIQADCNKIPKIDCTDKKSLKEEKIECTLKKPFIELTTKRLENESCVKHECRTIVGRSTNNEADANDQHTLEFKLVEGQSDVIMYMENKGSLMSEDRLVRFNAECLVLKSQGNEKVLLEFSHKAVKWYPILCPGAFYTLYVCNGGGPVLSDSLTNERLLKLVKKHKARRCLIVNRNVCVKRVWNIFHLPCEVLHSSVTKIQNVLKPDFSESLVKFEGWIVNRTLVKPGFVPKSLIKDIGAQTMYSVLHVQDSCRIGDIWVYLNDDKLLNARGLIPGSRVMFSGLERKTSKLLNIYCRLVPLSSVQVLCVKMERPTEGLGMEQNCGVEQQLPLLYLVDIWARTSFGTVFQCICDIEKIQKVSLKCVCETCGSLVVQGCCSSTACSGGEAYRFLARSCIVVDDSTSIAMVTVTGSSVQRMLQLSADQWKCLEEEVSQTGEVFVQQFSPALNTPLENFVYMLCDNHEVKQTWLMTLRTRSNMDISKIKQDEFCVKNFDTGMCRISTQCLPFLQLECISMTTFEPADWSMRHISAM